MNRDTYIAIVFGAIGLALLFLYGCGSNQSQVVRCKPVIDRYEYTCKLDGQTFNIHSVAGRVDLERMP